MVVSDLVPYVQLKPTMAKATPPCDSADGWTAGYAASDRGQAPF